MARRFRLLGLGQRSGLWLNGLERIWIRSLFFPALMPSFEGLFRAFDFCGT